MFRWPKIFKILDSVASGDMIKRSWSGEQTKRPSLKSDLITLIIKCPDHQKASFCIIFLDHHPHTYTYQLYIHTTHAHKYPQKPYVHIYHVCIYTSHIKYTHATCAWTNMYTHTQKNTHTHTVTFTESGFNEHLINLRGPGMVIQESQ